MDSPSGEVLTFPSLLRVLFCGLLLQLLDDEDGGVRSATEKSSPEVIDLLTFPSHSNSSSDSEDDCSWFLLGDDNKVGILLPEDDVGIFEGEPLVCLIFVVEDIFLICPAPGILEGVDF